MIGLDCSDISLNATILARLGYDAFYNSPFLWGDKAMEKVVCLLETANIGCEDFSQTGRDEDSGFSWNKKTKKFILNKSVIEQMFNKAVHLEHYQGVPDDEVLRDVIALFFFHEVFHILQGIHEFSVVQLLKDIAGKDTLGEMDTLADFVSARMYAAILTFGAGGDEQNFYKNVYATLEKSYLIGLRAFPFKRRDSHKVERGLSIFLARHRLLKSMRAGTCNYINCLAVHMRVDSINNTCLVMTLEGEPAKAVLLVKDLKPELVSELVGATTFGNVKFIEDSLQELELAA